MSLLVGQPLILGVEILCPDCGRRNSGVMELASNSQTLRCSQCNTSWQLDFRKIGHGSKNGTPRGGSSKSHDDKTIDTDITIEPPAGNVL